MHHSGGYPVGMRHVAIVLMTVAAPAWATDYFWLSPVGGSFSNPLFWNPASGPGGAADTVNFNLGMPILSRYIVSNVAGQNRRLLVRNDSVQLTFTAPYSLVETDADNPSLVVGVSAGNNADLLLFGAGPLTSEHAVLGLASGSQGVVTVPDGTLWINNRNLRVGGEGAGSLTVLGDVDVRQTLSIGSSGAIHLQGGRIRLENYERQGTFNFVAGTIRLGTSQFERFFSTDPAITDLFGVTPVVPAGKALEMERVAFIDTDMTVDGGTFMSLYQPSIGVEEAEGSLTIINGGQVTTPGGYISGSLYLLPPSAPGAVTVSGAGSTWNAIGAGMGSYALHVGYRGPGTLHILDGATVSSLAGWIGSAEGTSVAHVSGEGSSWTMFGDLLIGRFAGCHGILTIEDGADVASGRAFVGEGGNAQTGELGVGEVSVRGTGSQWTIQMTETPELPYALRIGVSGDGTVSVAEGARIRVNEGTGKVVLAETQGASGTLVLGPPLNEPPGVPGTLEAAQIIGGGGTGGARLAFNNTTTYFLTVDRTLTGTPIVVSGSTAVSLHGPGVVYFTAPQTYTGGTTINNNSLLVMRVNANITGDVVNNGGLAYQNDLPVLREVHGNISGTGQFFQTSVNGSVVRFFGTNTYTGGTTVNNGELEAASEGALPQNTPYRMLGGTLDLFLWPLTMSRLEGTGGTITGFSSLTVDQEDDTQFSGTLTGSIAFTKQGSGRLTLAGANTHQLATTVEDGTLRVNGQIISSTTTVQPGGTLDGSGSVAGLNNTGGVVAPGSGVGTLTVTENYAQDSTGVLRVQLAGTSAGAFDRLQVDGTATLGGKVEVELVDGFSPAIDDSFVILTAGSIVGQFDPPPAPWSLQYEPSAVRLVIVPVAADFDVDGDVDDDDVEAFNACRTRDKVPHDGSPECELADLDGDGDVDLDDFGFVQRCYAGPDVLPAPGCDG